LTTFNLSSPTQGQRYQAKPTKNGASVFVKNTEIAYVLTASACTEVTDLHYPAKHTYSVTSLTRSGTTATATVADTTGLVSGGSATIAGADQAAYNGAQTITVASGTTFTYTVAGSPATPATGTITAVGGESTVPGAVYLNNRMYVQKTTGEIVGSDSADVTSWEAPNTISPVKEPSIAVAIAKSLNYLVAFKQWDTEFYTDASIAAPASVLATVESAYLKLGAATADAIVEFDGGIVFMSKRDNSQRSREIHVLNGLTPKKISTPEVERILNGDTLATCYAMYLSTAGHQLYVLTLKTSAITLVYDFNTGLWHEWSFLTAQATKSCTITSADGIATVTCASHGYSDGDPITIAGAGQGAYNITENITYVSTSSFTYPVEGSPASPATGTITAMGYDESYFPGVAYAQYNNLDLVLHETNGRIYSLEPALYQDDSVPINVMLRTVPWDGGNQHYAFIASTALVGDRVDSKAMVRYSDDDGGTNSTYRPLDLNVDRERLTRNGRTSRRVWDIKHTADTALRLEALEIEATKGR
jgi:hypothetical protein